MNLLKYVDFVNVYKMNKFTDQASLATLAQRKTEKDVGTMTSVLTKCIADKRKHENDEDEGPSTKKKDFESASGSRCKNIDQKESASGSGKDFEEKDCKKDGDGEGPVTA